MNIIILNKGAFIKDHISKYKNKLLIQYIYLGFFFSVVLSPLYYYLNNIYLAATLNFFSVVMMYLLIHKNNTATYMRKSRIFIVAISILFTMGFIYGNQTINNSYFLLLFPIASFSIRGPKEGTLWAIILLAIFIGCYYGFPSLYNGYSFFFFCCSYFMVSYLLYYYRHYELKIFEHMYEVHELKNELEKKNATLNALATTDKLTNIANRNKLDHILEEEYQRTIRFGHPFSILIMDIDYFKKVNDTYGHQVGDQVLKEMASLLNYYIRDTDTVGRWGGEEFMIICPQTDEKGIGVLATTLKEKIEEHPFSIVKYQTASFGLTTYCPQDTIHSMIQKADKALYLAKKNGRNQVQQL